MSKLQICERKRNTMGKEMNEQERLQRVIDILADNADGMCYAVNKDKTKFETDMDEVFVVAKEISQLFENKIENLQEEINELENEMIQKELETL